MIAITPQPVPGMARSYRDPPVNLPFHGLVPRQVAIPAQAEIEGRSGSRQLHPSYIDRVRRRKTPNGPIFDDYDITPTDRAVHMPAMKHVLVSPSATVNDNMIERQSSNEAPRRHSVNTNSFPTRPWSTPYQNMNSQTHMGPDNRPAWDFPGGLDSVLNQTLPNLPTQRYYLQYGSSIPTVLPATVYPQMGPTASAKPELYGPYWPDGTFNPYRPAPVRDDRFYLNSRGPVPALHLANTMHYGPQHTLSSYTNAHAHNIAAPGTFQSYSRPPTEHYRIPLDQPANTSAFGQPSTFIRVPNTIKPTAESLRYWRQEQVFSWAQNVYLELLAHVHKALKQSPPQYRLRGQSRSSNKPLIFPRPPKRHTVSLSSVTVPFALEAQELHSPIPNLRTPNGHDVEHPSRPTTAIFTPSRRENSDMAAVWSTAQTSKPLRSFSDHYNEKYGLHENLPPAHIQRLMLPDAHTVHERATNALVAIEHICAQVASPWIDGILLAGCLAYGLDQYEKALEYFETILRHNETHVEAISNLAATLLSLDRRDEALQYWAAAIRLRPSHFEAVEHLIGLLCSEHRAKEAVSIIELVERRLRIDTGGSSRRSCDLTSDSESETLSRSSSINTVDSVDHAQFDHHTDRFSQVLDEPGQGATPGLGSSGYLIPGSDNGRMLALIHAKGNMLYSMGDNNGAAKAFEEAVLIATGHCRYSMQGLIRRILRVCSSSNPTSYSDANDAMQPLLLRPDQALLTAKRMFGPSGQLPGLEFIANHAAKKAAVSTTSNTLLSLAKIYQDGLAIAGGVNRFQSTPGTRDILALYYLSLALQPSPSTANNVGILLASVQPDPKRRRSTEIKPSEVLNIAGVEKGSGIELALLYYNFGLNLDRSHAHLYTNLGSLLKDIGQLEPAIQMYERAVGCDSKFDIALANLANAVKDQGRIADAINYYRRAVDANPDFAEAVCGLATALNSVCGWQDRGGVYADGGRRDRLHVDAKGMLYAGQKSAGWVSRVVEIVQKQLHDGESWGLGTLTAASIDSLAQQLARLGDDIDRNLARSLKASLQSWAGHRWEGSRIVRLIERANQRLGWQWYQERYVHGQKYPATRYRRHALPSSLSTPNAPTVLPFHTFTAPLSAKQIRQISQRNGLRISVSTMRSNWLPAQVYPPPPPPKPCLNVGYISSDFNNHPLAHLMQSIFGLHDPASVRAICYATTKSDGSVHRKQIEQETPIFHDVSSWSNERLTNQIIQDGVHILVNLNGYTRGARNEVFAARPAPLHMSFMGFAGSLGAEWCDYIFADEVSVPPETLSPWRRNVTIEDRLNPSNLAEDEEDWVYSENLIYARDTFFCVDHKQSAPDAKDRRAAVQPAQQRDRAWDEELSRRRKLRKEVFPGLSDNAVILGNFNQLYKIDPSIFCTWLQILVNAPNTILWLLRFPDLGEQNLLEFARKWVGPQIASRIVFTDVAAKGAHITRASVVDLFLDTPECNAHTTAADVVWSGTPILTWGKWKYKMCSRMAGSILSSALPEGREGDQARKELIVHSEEEYLRRATALARDLRYQTVAPQRQGSPKGAGGSGKGTGRLLDIRRMLWEGRWTSRLFDTERWVREVEKAYWAAWKKWEKGEGGDIWLSMA